MITWDANKTKLLIELYNDNKDILYICKKLKLKPSQVLLQLENLNLIKDNKSNYIDTEKNEKLDSNLQTELYESAFDKNENLTNGIRIKVKCLDCTHQKIYGKEEVSAIIESPASLKFLGRLFGRIQCLNCSSPRLVISKDNGKKILDFRNIKTCLVCADAITIQRIEILPKTNTCIICSDSQIDRFEYSFRNISSYNNCPKCNSYTYVSQDMTDGTERIYCLNFTKKDFSTNDEKMCNWFTEYLTDDEYNVISKKIYKTLRSLRLNYAKKHNCSPYKLITDDQMIVLSKRKFITSEDFIKLGLSGNTFIKDNLNEIISIFKN